jgi:hypothetical protein
MSMAQQMMNIMNQSMSQMQTPQFKTTDVPIINEAQYHVILNDIPQGPLTKNQVINHLKNGDLSDENLIWCEGMNGWLKIKDISL